MNQPNDDEAVAALEAFVSSVQHLPLFTGTAAQLIRSVDREDATAAELARLISTDGALVAHLLRVVNSAYYGLSRKIGTVSEAVAVLGLDLVRRTVTVAVLQRPLFAYLHDTKLARAYWRHELVCAALSRHLARRGGGDGEAAYMAGLLHGVGRLVMMMRHPELGETFLRPPRSEDEPAPVDDHGRARFGFTHAQVGAALLELWGLPEGIVQAAHQHLDETEPEEPLAAIVWRANRFADDLVAGGRDGEEALWMRTIGLSVTERDRILAEIEALENDA